MAKTSSIEIVNDEVDVVDKIEKDKLEPKVSQDKPKATPKKAEAKSISAPKAEGAGKRLMAYATTAINVRKEPNLNSEVIGTVFKNEKVAFEKVPDTEWFKVSTTSGLTGYCVSNYFVAK